MHTQLENSPAHKGQSKKSGESNPPVSKPSQVLVKAQLEMTTPGDSDEQEADAVADSIVTEGKIARSVSTGHSGGGIALPSQFASQISSFQGQGSRIAGDLKTKMESGFGRDFSNVRLHTDNAAAEMSSSISAKAFTYGNDIFFNRGQYSPDTKDGQRLIAHELTHVAQGRGKVERKELPSYLKKNDEGLMIEHLLLVAQTQNGYIERKGEENSMVTAFEANIVFDEPILQILSELKPIVELRDEIDKKDDKRKSESEKKTMAKKNEEIKTLIARIKSNEGWDEERWSNISDFILERDYVLGGGLSNKVLEDSIMVGLELDKDKDKDIFEETSDVLRKVLIRVQSGVSIDAALKEEQPYIDSLGLAKDKKEIIKVPFIQSILIEGGRNRDIAFLKAEKEKQGSDIKSLKDKIKKAKNEKKNLNKIPGYENSIKQIETRVSELNDMIEELDKTSFSDAFKKSKDKEEEWGDLSFSDALTQKKLRMEAQGIADEEIERVIGEINTVINERRKKQKEASLGQSLMNERKIMSNQGLSASEIDSLSKINKILDSPDLRKIVFEDPDNIKNLDLKGKYNNTIYHKQLEKNTGVDEHWCDHFVHWCFLKAFDPNQFSGWQDKNKNSVRNEILKYTMCEDRLGKHPDKPFKLQGSVHESIGYSVKGEHAFYNQRFSLDSIHDKFDAGFESGTRKEILGIISSSGKETDAGIEEKLKQLKDLPEVKTFYDTNNGNAKKWYNYMGDYLKLKKSYETIADKNNKIQSSGDTRREELELQPHIGDVFFMSGHIGIVTGVGDKGISTIEGNTDGQGSFSGNGAYKKTREWGKVLGFIRPDYSGLQKYLRHEYEKEQNEKTEGSAAGSPQEAQLDPEVLKNSP